MKYDHYIQEAKQTHKKAIFEARRVRQVARSAADEEHSKTLIGYNKALAEAEAARAAGKTAYDNALAAANEKYAAAVIAADAELQRVRGLVHNQV